MGAGAGALKPGAGLGVGAIPEKGGKGGSVTLGSVNTGSGGAGGGKYPFEICCNSLPGSTGLI